MKLIVPVSLIEAYTTIITMNDYKNYMVINLE